MLNNLAMLAARVLLAAIFLWSGFGTLQDIPGLAGYLGSLGLPLPAVLAPLVIVWELGGGLALLLGLFTRPAALLLGVFCLVTAVMVHYHPANMEAMINFAKNMAMSGGFLAVAAHGAGAWSVDEKLKLRWR